MLLVRIACTWLFLHGACGRSADVLSPRSPELATAALGMTAVLTATAEGSGPFSYQWRKDGIVIPNATHSELTLPDVTFSAAGLYDVTVSNFVGSTVSENSVALRVIDPSGRLANVSIRSSVGPGIESMVVGFALEGSAPTTLFVRGTGPESVPSGVTFLSTKPTLSIYSGAKLEGVSDTASNSRLTLDINAPSERARAAAVTTGSFDAALILNQSGSKTAVLSTSNNESGVAGFELYEDHADSATQMVNVSARLLVGEPERVSTITFVVTGLRSREFLLRAIGPSLKFFGVDGFLADPRIVLFRAGIAIPYQQNDDWEETAGLAEAFGIAGAFPLPPASRDAAMRVFLPPGSYTAQISSRDGSTGIVLVDIFRMP